MTRLNDLLEAAARYDERMKNIEKRVEDQEDEIKDSNRRISILEISGIKNNLIIGGALAVLQIALTCWLKGFF